VRIGSSSRANDTLFHLEKPRRLFARLSNALPGLQGPENPIAMSA
jgi:hypothetical protein